MDPQPHDLVTCPYNPAHQVEQYRMHLHLNKCSRQNVKSGKTTCPFDVTHVVDEVELDYHVAICPKRGMLDTQVYVTDNDHRPVVPVVQLPAPESSDDWENDAQTSFVPDPSKKPHVIQKIKGATASERKKARAQFTTQYKPLE
uniref:SFRICE_006623 n=1 Tax=Spodoptera frugiperda TaxID=7108 RepID=A0A2H1V7Z0_SPOFR